MTFEPPFPPALSETKWAETKWVWRFTSQSNSADFVLGSVSFPDVMVPRGLDSLKHVP